MRRLGGRSVSHFSFFVISKGRPDNVTNMESFFAGCGTMPTWIVGSGETDDYEDAGARKVLEGGGLCASRNKAIETALEEGKICVQMSDDLRKFQIIHEEGEWIKPRNQQEANERSKYAVDVSPVVAAQYVEIHMRRMGARLGGAYVTMNKGFAMNTAPVATQLFVVGDFLVIDPTSTPRFDLSMTLKEDYDFTAQHIHRYGVATRVNRVFVQALHYKNPGGAVAVRNDEREQENIAILRDKWPGVFRAHHRRGPNEVRMYWRGYGNPVGSKSSSSKKRRRGRATGGSRRVNMFHIFSKEQSALIQKEWTRQGVIRVSQDLQKEIGRRWGKLDENEREPYRLAAERMNDEQGWSHRSCRPVRRWHAESSDQRRQTMIVLLRDLLLSVVETMHEHPQALKAVVEWLENELYVDAEDEDSYLDVETLGERLCIIVQCLFEYDSQSMSHQCSAMRRWYAPSHDANRVSMSKIIRTYLLNRKSISDALSPENSTIPSMIEQESLCIEQRLYEASLDLQGYLDVSTLDFRLRSLIETTRERKPRLWFASPFATARCEMTATVMNFLKQRRDPTEQKRTGLSAIEFGVWIESAMYAASSDMTSYRDVCTLQQRLDNIESKLREHARKAHFLKKMMLNHCLLRGDRHDARAPSLNPMPLATGSAVVIPQPRKKSRNRDKTRRRSSKRTLLSSTFISTMIKSNAPISFNKSMEKRGKSYERYEGYKYATTCQEALEMGAKRQDIQWDLSKGIAKATDEGMQKEIANLLQVQKNNKRKRQTRSIERFEQENEPSRLDENKRRARKTARKSTLRRTNAESTMRLSTETRSFTVDKDRTTKNEECETERASCASITLRGADTDCATNPTIPSAESPHQPPPQPVDLGLSSDIPGL